MNYLAHMYLSGTNPGIIVGNMIGDHIKGNTSGLSFPDEIIYGIKLHRKIDSYTDSHPLVFKAYSYFPSKHRRYAPIVLDMIYDHFLAKNWEKYSQATLPIFTNNIYNIIDTHNEILPLSFQSLFRHMKENDWLTSYRDYNVINYALSRMSNRLTKYVDLSETLKSIDPYLDVFESDFFIFFDELKRNITK